VQVIALSYLLGISIIAISENGLPPDARASIVWFLLVLVRVIG
jgi:hypothetical protein